MSGVHRRGGRRVESAGCGFGENRVSPCSRPRRDSEVAGDHAHPGACPSHGIRDAVGERDGEFAPCRVVEGPRETLHALERSDRYGNRNGHGAERTERGDDA